MTVEELTDFLRVAFPDRLPEDRSRVVEIAAGRVVMSLTPRPSHLRPGGIIGGPTQMELADAAMYALILSHMGAVAMAVTTSLNMHFLRPARPNELFAEARFLRLGRRIATGEVTLWSEGPERPCGHAVISYALPQAEATNPMPAVT